MFNFWILIFNLLFFFHCWKWATMATKHTLRDCIYFSALIFQQFSLHFTYFSIHIFLVPVTSSYFMNVVPASLWAHLDCMITHTWWCSTGPCCSAACWSNSCPRWRICAAATRLSSCWCRGGFGRECRSAEAGRDSLPPGLSLCKSAGSQKQKSEQQNIYIYYCAF